MSMYSQTVTLKLKAEYSIPFQYSTLGMDLAYDGTDLWVSESISGDIYRIDTNGICLDTINSIKTTAIETIGSDLWLIHNGTWLCKIDKNNGQSVDSIRIALPQVLQNGAQIRDFCYLDSSFFSIWGYCYCGVCRILKTDVKTEKTSDLGDIPLFDNLVNINDTIWAESGSGMYPVYSNASINTNYDRMLYPGGFDISGLAFEKNNIWVIDQKNKKLKVFSYPLTNITASEKLISEDNIRIYPNPASDYVIIHTSGDIYDDNMIEVFNINGNKVISGRQQSLLHKLDLNKVASGLYLIRVSNSNQSVTRLFIKK